MKGVLRATAVLGVALASMWLALVGLRGPVPIATTAPGDQFSAERAFECVQYVGASEHPAGTSELERVRAWIVARIRDNGLEVEEQSWTSDVAAWNERQPVERELVNLVVRVGPRAQPPTASILLVAHYDSRAGCPGASDDGMGLAALLEVVRALHAFPLERTAIVVLLTDAEELGCVGAKQFIATQFARERVDAVINLDMLGNRGALQLIETGPDSRGLVRILTRCGARPPGSSFASEVIRFLPNRTDFAEFSRAGVRGVGFACVGGASVYHRAIDTPDRVDHRSLQQCGDTVLALARAIDRDGLERGSGKPTFFTLFGAWVVRYPPIVDMVIAVAAVLLLKLAWRGTAISFAILGGGLVNALLVWVSPAVAARVCWSLAQSIRWNDALAVSDERGLVALSMCVLGCAACLARTRFARRVDERATSLGTCCLWLAFGCTASVNPP